jgi:very-short-patch-repair endonuclease
MDGKDARLAALAARQHGVVSAAQAIAVLGSRDMVEHRLRTGRLFRVHRGVYAVGLPRLTREGRWMAAVLAGGEGAALSHRAALSLLAFRPPFAGVPDVTVPGRGGRCRRRGVVIHRSGVLGPDDITEEDGIPVTTPAWTLVDAAGVLGPVQLARALEAADKRGLFDLVAIRAEIERRPSARGTAMLRRLLADQAASSLTASDAEALLLELCRRHGIPLPATNVPIGPYVVDALWRRERLALEVDGEHHETKAASRRDRQRDRYLLSRGWRPARVTVEELEREPDKVVRDLRALLALPTGAG